MKILEHKKILGCKIIPLKLQRVVILIRTIRKKIFESANFYRSNQRFLENIRYPNLKTEKEKC